MSPQSAVWLGASLALPLAFALAVAFALAGLLVRCGPVDRPRERGMHTAPTPTSGGLAILAGAAAALLAALPAIRAQGGASPALTAAVLVALVHGLLGGLDDVFDFGAKAKLVAQLILALVFALVCHPQSLALTSGLALPLPAPISIAGTALWMVVVVNAVNFMDGSNGLIAGTLAVVLGGLGLRLLFAGDLVLAMAFLAPAAACLGFLPWNYPKARLFQGDVGALFLGALAAALAVAATGSGPARGPLTLLATPTALLPLLTDVLLTLIARARRRQSLFDAHKDHLYQRWLTAHGGDHAALAWRIWLIMGAYTLAAAVAAADPSIALATFLAGLAAAVGGWLWIDRTLK